MADARWFQHAGDGGVTLDDRPRYRHHFRCRSCATRFHVDRLTADPAKVKTPKCPKKGCAGKVKESFQADIPTDIAAGKAPGVIGANVQNRAYDFAMETTMQDQQIGDISDHSRPGSVYRAGEATAPKLRQDLQQKADSFWGGQQPKQQTRTARVDMSPLYGERATGTQQAQFRADTQAASLIEPILKHKPTGASPIPAHTVVAG